MMLFIGYPLLEFRCLDAWKTVSSAEGSRRRKPEAVHDREWGCTAPMHWGHVEDGEWEGSTAAPRVSPSCVTIRRLAARPLPWPCRISPEYDRLAARDCLWPSRDRRP